MKAATWTLVALGVLAIGCSGSSTGRDGAARDAATTEVHDDAPSTSDVAIPSDATLDAAPDAAPPDAAEVRDGDADVADAATANADRATMDADAAAATDADGAASMSADGGCADGGACVGSNWALWPMPNTAADVANGAPHPAMLVDNGDDTVTDGVTGLMWHQTVSVTLYDRQAAQDHCEALRAGGHDDWRIPSAIELASIVAYDKFNPSLDTTMFPDTPVDQNPTPGEPVGYSGTSTVSGTPVAGWLVDFAFGEIQRDSTSFDRGTYIRCVRPTTPLSEPATRYDLSAAGVAVDVKTGLAWQRVAPNVEYKWTDAKTYCAAGTGLPGAGWRLPTIKELMTLVDYAKATGFHVDDTVFNVPTTVVDMYGVFWSATSVVGSPYVGWVSGAWTVYFSGGENYPVGFEHVGWVRCVR